jgi:predicted ribosomally synthesized peptide with SipW-like signal peptide
MSTTTTAPAPAPERRRPWKKIAATGAIIAGGGALIAAGAFAIFTDSDSATLAVDAGQLDIVASGTYTVTNIAPGDTVQRPIAISLPNATNDGDLVRAVRFSIGVSAETIGTDDPALDGAGESIVTGPSGLNYEIRTCVNGTWTAVGTAPVGPYTCSTTEKVTSSGKLSALQGEAGAVTLLPGDFGVTPTADGTFPSDAGDVALNTVMVLTLPTAADNDYENAGATVTYTAAAIQRDGLQR